MTLYHKSGWQDEPALVELAALVSSSSSTLVLMMLAELMTEAVASGE